MPSPTTQVDDTKLRTTLEELTTSFFDSIENGSDALGAFDKSWTDFCGTVDACAESLQDDTRSMIHSFAEMVASVIDGVLEVEQAGETIRNQLQEDLTRITEEGFDLLTLEDVKPRSQTYREDHHPSYITRSYSWLLENLYNPYPSLEVRAAISRDHQCSRKDVDAWFNDARKRIGWNTLRKDHFSKKAELIAAATRFFKEDPTDMTLYIGSSTQAASRHKYDPLFIEMSIRAQNLYSGKFYDSSNTRARTSKSSKKSHRRKLRPHPGASSYPSPQLSADDTPEVVSPTHARRRPWDSSESSGTESEKSSIFEGAPPYSSDDPIQSGTGLREKLSQKRRLSSSTESEERHRKQARMSSYTQAIATLPSPILSSLDLQTHPLPPSPNSDDSSHVHSSSIGGHANSSSMKRKRRLSDAAGNAVKRPHLGSLPRTGDPLPTVSHTVPVLDFTHDRSHTYNFCSEMPEPVSAVGYDSRAALDMECFAYEFSPMSEGLQLQHDSPVGPVLDLEQMSCVLNNDAGQVQEMGLGFISFSDGLLDINVGDIAHKNDFSWDTNLDEFDPTQGILSSFGAPPSDFPSLGFDWIAFPSQAEAEPSLEVHRTSVLTDANYSLQSATREGTADATKHERIQQLRDELRRLEADLP